MRGLKKLHPMAQIDRHAEGHGDSMTESAQWADSVKMLISNTKVRKIIFFVFSFIAGLT